MSAKPVKPIAPSAIDPAGQYRVELADRVVLGPDWVLYPGQNVTMSGALLREHLDRVRRAEPLPDLTQAAG